MNVTHEHIAIHTALWGDLEVTIDEWEAGHLDPARFCDPSHRAVLGALSALIEAGQAPYPWRVIRHLIDVDGWAQADAVDAVNLPGAFEAAGCHLDGLAHHLFELDRDQQRDELEQRLVALADSLHRPGGVARVAALLKGREVAA